MHCKEAWLITVRYYQTKGIEGIEKIANGYETEKDGNI